MNPMLEKAALAVLNAGRAHSGLAPVREFDGPEGRFTCKQDCVDKTLAALRVLPWELSEEAMQAGAIAGNWHPDFDERERMAEAGAVFQAMIDTITGEADDAPETPSETQGN